MLGSSVRLLAFLVGVIALIPGIHSHLVSDIDLRKDGGSGEIVQLKRTLAQGAQHPAIFLGGGSNMFAGVRAETIHEMTNRPVYNLGLTNELGDYRSALAFLEQAAQSGDILIYASRGIHVQAPIRYNGVSLVTLNESRNLPPKDFRFELPERSILRMLRHEVLANPWEQIENLNSVGDFMVCLKSENGLIPMEFVKDNISGEQFLKELSQFSLRMKQRGVKVFLMAPSLLVKSEDLPHWKAQYRATRALLKKNGAELLNASDSEIFITDPQDFCDAPFHPNEARAIINSRLIAEQLAGRN